MTNDGHLQFAPAPAVKAIQHCRTIRRLGTVTVLLCALAQVLIEGTLRNAGSVLLVASTSVLTFELLIRAQFIRGVPLPTLVVLGFNVATLSGALVVQTFSLRPLVFNLDVPLITFGACATFQLSLIAALLLFTLVSPARHISQRINQSLFKAMGLMRAPDTLQLWLMGAIGIAAMGWSAMVAYTGDVQYGDVAAKFVQGLRYLAYAPFLIPVLHIAFPRMRNGYKQRYLLLILYFLLLVIVAIAGNSRAAFAVGVANLGMAAILLVLLGQLEVLKRVRLRLAVGAALFLFLTPILADLATAMVVVRGSRTEVSTAELVESTLAAFQDKDALDDYRKTVTVLRGQGEYEEYYVNNLFLARFIQTKFFDNTLALGDVRSGRHAAEIWSITLKKGVALLPTPLLRLFGLEIDKADLEFSIGDALYWQQYGTGLGGYRTGSTVGHGLALMGPIMYIVVVPLFVVVFIALQSLSNVSNGMIVISPLALLQLMSFFQLASLDSLLDPVALLARWLPQTILIYWLVFHLTRPLLHMQSRTARVTQFRGS